VLDCLTSNPDVWARTVFLVNFDENDGFFDHVPPPAPPSKTADGKVLGGSTVDATAEYHLARADSEKTAERDDLMGRPYGLGPRVPLYVISPWSRGGWANAEVFDHTSIIRFCEARFGVIEPNISPWRRAVCGDLTSCFDFRTPNAALAELPDTAATAERAAALPGRTKPPTPSQIIAPVQATGLRRSRALAYSLDAALVADTPAKIAFYNKGSVGAVFHVYDCQRPEDAPRRYTVEALKTLEGEWPAGEYDLFVVGPNGFHRRFRGGGGGVLVSFAAVGRKGRLRLQNTLVKSMQVAVTPGAYGDKLKAWDVKLAGGKSADHVWDLSATGGWYDMVIKTSVSEQAHRIAGRVDNGEPSTSDPAMGGAAVMSAT
jgi:phospholipase C